MNHSPLPNAGRHRIVTSNVIMFLWLAALLGACSSPVQNNTPPPTPTGLQVTADDIHAQIYIKCGTSPDAGWYQLYRSQQPGGTYQLLARMTIALASRITLYTDISARPGTRYYYRVRAFTDEDSSSFSDYASDSLGLYTCDCAQYNAQGKLYFTDLAEFISDCADNPNCACGLKAPVVSRAAQAMLGWGVAEAKAYDSTTTGIHHVVMFKDSLSVSINFCLPDAWLAQTPDELELLVLYNTWPVKKAYSHSCTYCYWQFDCSYVLVNYRPYIGEVVFVEARSGQIIVRDTIWGSAPICPGSMDFAGTHSAEQTGSVPAFNNDSLKAWVAKYVQR